MGYKILIVDDSKLVRDVIKVHLSGSDYEFCEATDGEKALDVLRSAEIDLIISDLNMPKLDGVAFIKRVRSHLRTSLRSVPILLLTAVQAADEWKRTTLEAGATAFIQKPVAGSNLLELVRQHLPARA